MWRLLYPKGRLPAGIQCECRIFQGLLAHRLFEKGMTPAARFFCGFHGDIGIEDRLPDGGSFRPFMNAIPMLAPTLRSFFA